MDIFSLIVNIFHNYPDYYLLSRYSSQSLPISSSTGIHPLSVSIGNQTCFKGIIAKQNKIEQKYTLQNRKKINRRKRAPLRGTRNRYICREPLICMPRDEGCMEASVRFLHISELCRFYLQQRGLFISV